MVRLTTATEWASGDLKEAINWAHESSGDLTYHKFFRANQQEFHEDGEIAAWGMWYLTTSSNSGVSGMSWCLEGTTQS